MVTEKLRYTVQMYMVQQYVYLQKEQELVLSVQDV